MNSPLPEEKRDAENAHDAEKDQLLIKHAEIERRQISLWVRLTIRKHLI